MTVTIGRVFCSLLLIMLGTGASAVERPAWTLTATERVARRVPATGTKAPRLVIDGSKSPELFLPGELMAFLLNSLEGGDSRHRSDLRNDYLTSLARFGWAPEAFWRDLETSANDFLRLTRRMTPLDRGASRLACSHRIAALNAMRTKYARFDEFLYVAVAPRHRVTSDRPTSTDWLLWVEGGCL